MRIIFLLSLLLAWNASISAFAQAQKPLRIGVASYTVDSVKAAAEEAKKQGIEIKLVEFGDWTTPNLALDSGDLDLNYFQHQGFLDASIKARGYKIKSVDIGYDGVMNLISLKITKLDQLKPGAVFAIYNDPANQARALGLLQHVGLIKLRSGAKHFATLSDVVENPLKIKFVEIEGTQILRSLSDVDFAATMPFSLVLTGKRELLDRVLAVTPSYDPYYAVRFVTRNDNSEDPQIRKFIKIYHESPAVRKSIHEMFAGDPKLYNLPWLTSKASN